MPNLWGTSTATSPAAGKGPPQESKPGQALHFLGALLALLDGCTVWRRTLAFAVGTPCLRLPLTPALPRPARHRRQLLLALAEWLCANWEEDELAGAVVRGLHLHLLPSMNPDGFALGRRANA